MCFLMNLVNDEYGFILECQSFDKHGRKHLSEKNLIIKLGGSHVTQTELDVSNFRSVLFDNLFLYWTDLLDFSAMGSI